GVSLAYFSRQWLPEDYFFPSVHRTITALSAGDIRMAVVLSCIALPFIFCGLMLTIKRLRHAGLPEWLCVLFFVPLVNLLFFALLAVLPENAKRDLEEPVVSQNWVARLIPRDKMGSAAAGVVLGAILGVLLV